MDKGLHLPGGEGFTYFMCIISMVAPSHSSQSITAVSEVPLENASLWVRPRRRYLRYCYHSIFVLHLMNDKDRMIVIA